MVSNLAHIHAPGGGSTVIAVDGPAGAGKGTLSRRLAVEFGFAYLDTGLLYRAVGARALQCCSDASLIAADVFVAAATAVAAGDLDDPMLRSDAVAQAASRAAAIPAVRQALLEFQRAFARQPPGAAAGAVLDGRDIGTVVWPQARFKFFVTADLPVRAARRVKELRDRGHKAIHADVLRDMQDRDARDSERSVAPLAPAADALLIDTSDLSPDAVFAVAVAFVCSGTRSSR